MILYEFEGKELLKAAGIEVPKSQLVDSIASLQNDRIDVTSPLVLKAQVLSGKRAQSGGIVTIEPGDSLEESLKLMFGREVNKEKVERVLIEEKVEIEKEFYLSLSYDTQIRGPLLTVSESGGTGIETREVKTYPVEILNPKFPQLPIPGEILDKLFKSFLEQDCVLLEINPLVKSVVEEWLALDAKINLDDSALGRHEDWKYPPRSAPGYTPTEREIEAKKIDEGDYRGVAGSTYFDLDGDIAVLASGGGASLTALDALIKVGGSPANYTEYGGNPPKEKVEKLTQVVMSKPNLHALWVVGAVANFTDVYATLSGFLEALRKVNPPKDFPIVIRRGGPRDQEAFEMLKQVKDFNLHLYGPETTITESAEIVAGLAKDYASK